MNPERKPYRPPRIRTQKTFEQNTLSCGKTNKDHLIQACKQHKKS